jgi:mono/diheme cytochrome c family protein
MPRLPVFVLTSLLALFAVEVASAQPPAAAAPAAEVDPAHAEKMQEGLSLFKSQVRQVLIDQCVDCHGGSEVESGFDLATRKGLLRGGSHGPSVVVGKSADSNVVRFISHKEKPFMPDGADKLPEEQIAAIARWIDLGAPYDKPLVDNPRDPDAWTATVVPAKAREFWAFQPLANVEPPAVNNEAWCRNPIDRFILAKLAEKGISPNSPAERRVLIRRAWFDLVGLPPPPEEVEAFIADPDPRAYEMLLDRLLESPHYGERWARHWLDAARFAESHGFEQDYDRPHAYHYRDFVIEAFNQDMPYDQFVRWQLAGDEFEPENPLALKATGFLGAGVFPTQITANEVERTRYDALDDMAATTGSAMLGLSIGCARCHDHKFDPIPQADYYRFLSTFTTTVRSDLDVDLTPEKTKAALAAWEKEHEPKAAVLKAFEESKMPREFQEWLDESPQLDGSWRKGVEWIVFDKVDAKSKNGATLTVQDDGSIVASGKNPDSDTYTISTQPFNQLAVTIETIRLEALPDPALVKSGPGRADNGNFALSRIRLFAENPDGSKRRELKLVHPRADFQQNDSSLSIAASLDEDPKTGWAVDPQFGQKHIAVFDVDASTPGDSLGGQRLVFELEFAVNAKHTLGKLRLACGYWGLKEPLTKDPIVRSQSLTQALNMIDGSGSPILVGLEEPHKKALLDEFKRQSPRWNELNGEVQKSLAAKPQPNLVKMMVCSEGVTPIRHHTQGADFFNETHFLKRGDCDQKMGVASQSFLQVLMTAPEREQHWQVPPPEGVRTSYRRRALANWITDTEYGAGHLLARVIVNRLWHHHFGRGIVATPSDFGVQGAPPTHPELLDWLAAELIRGGWKLKPLHKQIMLSAAYMQDSRFDAADATIDPENTWLWRREPQRLEAEVIRDNLLAVSGTLDRTQFGPGTLDEGHKRRSIYFMVKRSKLVPMMQLFDQPEPLVSVGGRPSTTIAPQALALLNSPHVRGYAHRFAQRLLPAYEKSPAEAVTLGYVSAIGRLPDDEELAASVAFLAALEKSHSSDKDNSDKSRELALADFCQVLFGLNEFVYVE